LSIHEQQLAGAELVAARVVVDAERQVARGVVDGEAVGALEAHAGAFPDRVHRRMSRAMTSTTAAAGGVGRGRVYPAAAHTTVDMLFGKQARGVGEMDGWVAEEIQGGAGGGEKRVVGLA
jgi:hypothetical protein